MSKCIRGWLAAILIAAMSATPAHADGFKNREIAFQALNAIDAAQTCQFIGSGRGSELNPLLGKHPSCPKVIGFKLATGVIHYLIADHLNDRNPKAAKVFQIVSIVVQAGGVALNFRLVL